MPGWWYVVTAAGFLDMLENLPDVIELAPKVKSPTLYVRGDQEPAALYPAEEFKSRAGGESAPIRPSGQLRPLLPRLRGSGLRDRREVARENAAAAVGARRE